MKTVNVNCVFLGVVTDNGVSSGMKFLGLTKFC